MKFYTCTLKQFKKMDKSLLRLYCRYLTVAVLTISLLPISAKKRLNISLKFNDVFNQDLSLFTGNVLKEY